jgi:single-stranded-DNA-specific exonuclease
MEKSWKHKKHIHSSSVDQLASLLGIDRILANLLVQRGVTTFDEARLFFRPDLSYLHDPFLMKDMDAAVDRIDSAISKGEKILVYGDYDVDGTTSVALMYQFIKARYERVEYYIPDRYKEGYGISFAGIDYAAANGFSLIISLDCGIKANDKVLYAHEREIDFIICDHHLPGETLPVAIAVLDPKRNDCPYPFKELSGCGVGFKLAQAYCIKHKIDFLEIGRYLDLVAVSIASDIVPIIGENRILAHFGLQKMRENPCMGIKAIMQLNNIRRNLTITDIVFIIGPRINAAGRVDDAKNAVRLLIATDEEDAHEAAQKITSNNSQRQNLDASTTQQAVQMIRDSEILQNRKTTVLFNPDWHKGVIGIVASRLIDKYFYRPTIIFTDSNGKAAGSARTVKDFDIYNAIDACSDLLEQFGGHKHAAGLTLKLSNIDVFADKFEEVVSSTITDEELIPEVEIDAMLPFHEISPKFFRVLKQFAPFGPGNMMPLFMAENVRDVGNARIVGKDHLKLDLTNEHFKGQYFAAIAFQQALHYNKISKGAPFNICYSLEENEWNGNTKVQLNIKDINF